MDYDYNRDDADAEGNTKGDDYDKRMAAMRMQLRLTRMKRAAASSTTIMNDPRLSHS